MAMSTASCSDHSSINGGYDLEFLDEVPSALECSICQLTLRDPVQVRDCGHRFCKTCIQEHQRCNGAWCPNDRSPLGADKLFDDMACKRHVHSLKVKCSNEECKMDWRTIKFIGSSETECKFTCVQCPNIPCDVSLLRTDILNHADEECKWRPILCLFCGKSSPWCKKDSQCFQHEQHLKLLLNLEDQYNALKDQHDQLLSKVNDDKVQKQTFKKIEDLEEQLLIKTQNLSELQIRMETKLESIQQEQEKRSGMICISRKTCAYIVFPVLLVIILALLNFKHDLSKTQEQVHGLKTALSELKRDFKKDSELVFAEIPKQVKDASKAIEAKVNIKFRTFRNQFALINNFGELFLRIENISDVLKKGKEETDKYFIDSPPVYSQQKGFKLKMRVFPGGTGSGAGNYLSVAVVIMRGDYDYQPKMWPFRKTLRFTLIDQDDIANRRKDVIAELVPGAVGSDGSFIKPVGSENKHRAIQLFYSHYNLKQGSYIRDDTLLLKMEVL